MSSQLELDHTRQLHDSYKYARALSRAFAGALLFSLPLQMTMEMWWLGFYISPIKLLIFLISFIPLLICLAYYSGFEAGIDWRGAVIDAFVAIAVGCITSAACLGMFGILGLQLSASETLGKIMMQSVAGAFGATLATSQLGISQDEDSDGDDETLDRQPGTATYLRELLLMVAGALFFGLNVAPTEEMTLIAYRMTAVHGLILVAVSLISIHAFVYFVSFRGQEAMPKEQSWWSLFARYSIVGYALAILVSLYCLWIFERTSGVHLTQIAETCIVLGFPCSIGAASARLVL